MYSFSKENGQDKSVRFLLFLFPTAGQKCLCYVLLCLLELVLPLDFDTVCQCLILKDPLELGVKVASLEC